MFYKNIALYHEGHDHGCGCGEHHHEHVHGENCGCGGHVHEHDHVHEDQATKDEKTLNILLVHWVNHNESHEEGFKEWVEKAKNLGKNETAEYIDKAIEYMQKANEMLMEAKKHM